MTLVSLTSGGMSSATFVMIFSSMVVAAGIVLFIIGFILLDSY